MHRLLTKCPRGIASCCPCHSVQPPPSAQAAPSRAPSSSGCAPTSLASSRRCWPRARARRRLSSGSRSWPSSRDRASACKVSGASRQRSRTRRGKRPPRAARPRPRPARPRRCDPRPLPRQGTAPPPRRARPRRRAALRRRGCGHRARPRGLEGRQPGPALEDGVEARQLPLLPGLGPALRRHGARPPLAGVLRYDLQEGAPQDDARREGRHRRLLARMCRVQPPRRPGGSLVAWPAVRALLEAEKSPGTGDASMGMEGA